MAHIDLLTKELQLEHAPALAALSIASMSVDWTVSQAKQASWIAPQPGKNCFEMAAVHSQFTQGVNSGQVVHVFPTVSDRVQLTTLAE